MPKRPPHPDNELIDSMQEEGTPAHQGRAGGNVQNRVGTRAELERAAGGDEGVTRATGKDKPVQDRKKGDKTRDEIQRERDASS